MHIVFDLFHILHPSAKNAFALLRAVFALGLVFDSVHLGCQDNAALLDIMELFVFHSHLLLQICLDLWIYTKQILVVLHLHVAGMLNGFQAFGIILKEALRSVKARS